MTSSFMDPLPIEYLHLETIVMPLFLAMVLLIQLARSTEGTHFMATPRRQWIGLVMGFFLLALAFGALLFSVSPLLAGELAAGFTLSLLHPVNALCFFVHLLYLRPWEIATTNPLLLALPRVVAMLCLFSWLLHPASHAKPSRRTLQGVILLLCFSVWLFATTFFTPDIGEAQSDWFQNFFKSLIIFVMTVFFIESRRSLTQFTLTLVLSALALMIVRFYQYHTEGPTLIRLESGGMFGDPNDLAAVIVMALPFALVAAFQKASSLMTKTVGCLFAGFSLLLIWYSQSRGAMLALTVQVLSAGVLWAGRKRAFMAVLLAVVLGSGYFVVIKTIARDSQEMQESSDSRIMYWKAAISMTLHHPLFGVGYNQYGNTYGGYSSGERYEWGKRTAHSSWFLVFAESGFIGGLLYVSFFLLVLWTAWQHHTARPDQLLALIGYGVVMSFLSHTYLLYFYVLSGLILGSASLSEQLDDGT